MPIPLLVQLLCKSINILDIDGTTNAGDEPAPIEMRFHVKTLLTFASRSCAALKGRLSVPVMAGVLALALAAAPLPAMADEEATQTVTIYHFELVHYDDPTLEDWGVPELTGTRLLGTTTVEGLKPGDVVKAWDHVGTNPGYAFFDGWPRELTVSEDPSKNAIRLNYFRQSSDVTPDISATSPR